MAILRGNRRAPTVRPKGNLDQIPVELDISTSVLAMAPRLAFGLIFAVIGFNSLGRTAGQAEAGKFIELVFEYWPVLFLILGLALIANAAIGLSDKRTLRIESGQVSVTGRRFMRSESWSEPLSAYEGVRAYDLTVKKLVNTQNVRTQYKIYHTVELKHPNPVLSVPLHVTRIDGVTRGIWENAAKLLGVPAIDETGSETRVRAAEDVDKSVKELASDGKIKVEWDDTAPPPPDLALTQQGSAEDPDNQTLLVSINGHQGPVWIYAVIFAIGLIPLLGGLTGLEVFPIIFGGAICGGVVWFWRYENANPRTVRITRSTVEIISPVPLQKPKEFLIRHGAIEGVEINKRDDLGVFGSQLSIVTDQRNYNAGSGLSQPGLSWLRNLILAAVAKA